MGPWVGSQAGIRNMEVFWGLEDQGNKRVIEAWMRAEPILSPGGGLKVQAYSRTDGAHLHGENSSQGGVAPAQEE